MAKPKINQGDFGGLKEKGVSPETLRAVRNAVALGAKIKRRRDLIDMGISVTDADLIATNASLDTDPVAKPVHVQLKVTPDDLIGYALGVRRQIKNSGELDEELIPIAPPGAVNYVYDDNVTGNDFTIFVKTPGGDYAQSTVNGTQALEHAVKKADLGKHPIAVTPVAEIQNAKSLPVVADPALSPTRAKGRLICGNPDVVTEKRQIVIEAAVADPPEDGDYIPIGYAETETNGYFVTSQLQFSDPADFKSLTAARAKVAMQPAITIPIRLEAVAGAKGRLPQKLILYFDLEANSETDAAPEGDCDCDTGCGDLNFYNKKVLDEFSYYTVVRTTEPLIETYEIDDVDEIDLDDLLDHVDPDIRGVLTGLTVNRNLISNFIARNRTITKANVGQLVSQIDADKVRRRVLQVPPARKGRVLLDRHNEIDWDEKPTVYQSISVAHGHLLHFKQEWFHDGYSLGDLLYSLPLAPGQKKQIVVFDWDRKESAANVQQLDYQESLYNSLSRDRDVNEVARATLTENIRGSSESSTWGVGGGLGIGAIIPTPVPIGALLGVAGGYGSGSSSARQDASRTSTASSHQQISDRTVQAANSVRSQRSTVVQTVSQGERFEVSAESVANYNHCHAITIQYFEVLRHFEARTRLADVQECLFVPLRMSPFTPQKALRWRDILFRSLRKRFLAPGFDALFRIEEERESSAENYYDRIGLPRDRYAEEELQYVEGELRMEFQVQRPRNDENDEFVEALWAAWIPFIGNAREFYDRYLRREQQKDEAFARNAGPRIAQAICDNMKFFAVKNGAGAASLQLPIDATLLSEFRNRRQLTVTLRMGGALQPVKREDIDFVRITLEDTADGRLLPLVGKEALRIIVHAGQMRYRTRSLHEYLFNSTNIRNDLTLEGDDVRIFCPLSDKALRKPRQEDVDAANSLLHHLNENLEFYHQKIWGLMDPQRRYMLLDGVVAPGRGEGRSVASVVENKLIGIIGNSLVMPVAPGFKLDPVLDENVDLFEHYYEEPRDPIHLSLPTKGVFAEAVMGNCNSCEKKDETRFWRWEESPVPDSPTDINAVTVPTPQPSQPDLTGRDFPAPIIALQNAPAAPDPQGFGALLTLLGKGDLFRDLTGLSENQKNALAALQGSLKTAEAFGEGAQALTGQAAELLKFNKLSEMLGNGQITKEEFKEFVDKAQQSPDVAKLKEIKDAVDKKQIAPEAGERLNEAELKKAETQASNENRLTADPAVRDKIKSGGSFSATETTPEGTTSVSVEERSSDDRSFIIEASDLDSNRRSFGARNRDKTGSTSLRVRVPNLPTGGSVRWSIPPGEAGHYSFAGGGTSLIGLRADLLAMQPGLSAIDCEVVTSGGRVLESLKFPLSVPQFVTIDIDAATFTPLMTGFGLIAAEIEEVLAAAKETCDAVLSSANVRTIWRMAPFNEVLPAQFAGASVNLVTTAQFQGNPPTANLLGRTTYADPAAAPNTAPIGPQTFNDRIVIWPGAFDDPIAAGAVRELDDATIEILRTILSNANVSSTEKSLGFLIFGRCLGETLAHEIVHSLVGFGLTGGVDHNPTPGNEGDLMNLGRDRSFTARSGFEIVGTIGTDALSDAVQDRGVFFVNIISGDAQTVVNDNFPVPGPAFP